jgi:hypothetical protein
MWTEGMRAVDALAFSLTRLASWSARSLAARETERSERRRARRKSMVIAVVASVAAAILAEHERSSRGPHRGILLFSRAREGSRVQ